MIQAPVEPKTIELQATRLFYRNRDSTAKIVCNRGGTRSGKSWAIAQVLFLDKFFNEKNKKFLVLRKTLPSLKLAALADFKKFVQDYGLENRIVEEKQSLNYYYRPNKNYLHFGALDDPDKIRSTAWNYIWTQEATDFTYEDYLELKRRLSEPSGDGRRNQLFMCLNPTDEYSWIKEKVLDKEKDVDEIHSTHLDNPFLSDDYRQDLEALIEQDINHYRIYVQGEWGRLEDLIYRNWTTVQEIPEGEVVYGLDFGFVNPSALVKCTIVDRGKGRREAYMQELLYEPELTNADLISRLKRLIPRRAPLYADPAEPARIKEIYDEGYNVLEADKRVLDGIDFLKSLKLFVHEESLNLSKELKAYSRRKDKQGRLLEEPIKYRDHGVDAMRYALYTHLKDKVGGGAIRWI